MNGQDGRPLLQGLGLGQGQDGKMAQAGGLTVTDDVDGNEPLLDGPPTTVELHASQPGQRSQAVSAF